MPSDRFVNKDININLALIRIKLPNKHIFLSFLIKLASLDNYKSLNTKIHYILSRNRSGSTLLVNLLNNHPDLSCISELNSYWLLRTDYLKIKDFNEEVISQLITDLFFSLDKKGHEFTKYMLPNKEKLKSILLKHKPLNFQDVCRIINLQVKTSTQNKENVNKIIKKDINFNHLIDKIYKESPQTKFIILARNHRANIYSSLKFNAVKNNCIYEAKRWELEMKPLIKNSVPSKQKLIVKYKDLINNTEDTLKKIQLFLEIPLKNELAKPTREFTKKMIYDEAKKNSIDNDNVNSFIKNHFGSFSRIDPTKINEWENKQFFSKLELKKIDYICKDVAIPLGFKCSTKKVSFSTLEHYYIFLANIHYYITSRYITMPIAYKRCLEKFNIFNFFN